METSFEEIRQILRESAIAQQELRELFKETDAKFKETADRFKDTDAKFKDTDRKLKDIGRNLGNIGERFGSFTEGLAYPSLCKILYKRYSIDNTVTNYLKNFPDGRQVELDAFGFTNGSINNAVVVEVKTHLQSKHIYQFKELLKNFKTDFPEFANKHLYGILTTARVVSKELKQEIFENGLHLAIVHDEVFDFKQNPNAIDFNL
jgi:hypothetical protein